MEPWLDDLSPTCAPAGFLAWSRGYATWEEGWDPCPHAEWRLWLAELLASDPARQLECARAAFHVARTMIALVPNAGGLASRVLDLAEVLATRRWVDDEYLDALDEVQKPTTMPHSALGQIVHAAAWFASFDACIGVDGACNVIDLFAAARELAQHVGAEERVFSQLDEDLRSMLTRPAPAEGWTG
jgi:hypothetical protein